MKNKIPKVKYLMGNFQFWWLNEEDIGEDYDFQDAHLDLMTKKPHSFQIKILNTKSTKTEDDLNKFCLCVSETIENLIKKAILKNEEKEDER